MNKANNPIISFIGYNLLVLPIGCCVSIIVPSYGIISIILACIVTTGTTLVMISMAIIKPDFFLEMKRVLFLSLLFSIAFELILLLFGIDLKIWDWIVSIIFCGYIGYDFAKMNNVSYLTLDYAVDSAGNLYLDIINLFSRILSIIGGGKSRKH